MNENMKQLLYTTKEGEFVDLYEMEMLDDDEIPWDRMPALKALLIENYSVDELQTSLNAAQILCSWGVEDGLRYLEFLVDGRVDRKTNYSPHRLKGYDQIYENISGSVINFYLRKAEEGDGIGLEARARIKEILQKIIVLSNSQPFDIQTILTNVKTYRLTEYISELKKHLIKISDDEENQYWKMVDCLQVLHEFEPGFVEHVLAEKGKSLLDYKSDFRGLIG